MTKPASDRYDAIIVGARCAGAASAMLLARRGMNVLVLDRQDYGADTLSTHALMRGAVIQLGRWGLLDTIKDAGTPPVTATVFHYGDDELTIPIKPGNGVDALYAPRRTLLDRVLVDAARQAGAEIVHGHSVVDLIRSRDERVCGVGVRAAGGDVATIKADLVIGADGLRSTVARLCAAPVRQQGQQAAASIYGYFLGLDRDRYHWLYNLGVSATVIPTNAEAACVSVLVPQSRFMREMREDVRGGFARALAEISPAFAEEILLAPRVGPLRAFAGAKGFMRQSHGPGWALVGDAGYFKDPLTAHGITDAFRDAALLARAAAEGTSEAWQGYQIERDGLSRDFFTATDAITSFAWDLETVRPLHRQLSEAMKREVAAIMASPTTDSLAA